MEKILIVDDEHAIVNYIASLLQSGEDDGWEIYKAYNGLEALELLGKTRIDLALMDIHMPGMHGLEVGEKIAELWPECRIIFLTAYDRFDYIYKAGKQQMAGYILKTEDDSVILAKVREVISEIRREKQRTELLTNVKKQELLLPHLLSQEILKELISGVFGEQTLMKAKMLGGKFALDLSRPLCLIYVSVQRNTYRKSEMLGVNDTVILLQSLRKLLPAMFQFSLLGGDHRREILFVQPRADRETSGIGPIEYLKGILEDILGIYVEKLHKRVKLLLYYRMTEAADIAHTVQRMEQFGELNDERRMTSEPHAMVFGADELDWTKAHTSDNHAEVDALCPEMHFYLQRGEREKYFEIFVQIRQECTVHKSMHHFGAIKSYNVVALMLLQYISQNNLEPRLSMMIALYPLYYLNDFTSWEQAFSYLERLSEKLFELQTEKQMDKNTLLVQRIKSYIQEHYSEPLNLSMIAAHVNYNESYISRIFKQTTHGGISDYITQVRLERAKQLLSTTNLSVAQIAMETGFDTSQYFSSVFRKNLGLSPSDYRKL